MNRLSFLGAYETSSLYGLHAMILSLQQDLEELIGGKPYFRQPAKAHRAAGSLLLEDALAWAGYFLLCRAATPC